MQSVSQQIEKFRFVKIYKNHINILFINSRILVYNQCDGPGEVSVVVHEYPVTLGSLHPVNEYPVTLGSWRPV